MDRQLETMINFFLDKIFLKYLIKNTDKNSQDIYKIEIFQNFGIFERVGNEGLL
jgi:hypothetical protein